MKELRKSQVRGTGHGTKLLVKFNSSPRIKRIQLIPRVNLL